MTLHTFVRTMSLLGLIAVATAQTHPAWAQDSDDLMQAMRIDCTPDYVRFCAGMNPEGQEVKACFHRNRPRLSAACSSAISAYENQQSAPDSTR